MTGRVSFRNYLYAPDDPRVAELRDLDAYGYREHAKGDDFTGGLIQGWKPLQLQQFRGVTSDGNIIPNLYPLQPAASGEQAPTPQMVEAAHLILRVATAEQIEQMRFAVDAVEWQTWANPEFMQFDTGVRLENVSEALREAILGLIAATLSEDGYAQARTLMRINGFLGDIVELPALMNEYSYNFALYGEPSLDAPWGWQLFGHHLAMNALVVRDQLVVTPVFFGAEPDIIDDGPFAGSTVFDQRIALARRLMQSLPAAQRDRARIFDQIVDPAMPPGRIHPGDERHLAGAFQDNRVIPYEGIPGSELNGPARNLLSDLIGEFLTYLPAGPAAARRREVDAHLEQTWFSWIGGYGPDEPFYLRAQSPVIIVELDHHCGVFLSNTTPAPFHIHTVVRTPNGNDYGRALVRAYESRS